MLVLSNRANACKESATLAITQRANELKAKGLNVIGFGAGEPDFEPSVRTKGAAIAAIEKTGTAKYTPVAGIPVLKEEIIKKFKKDNGIDYAQNEIVVNSGAKHSIELIMRAIINPGDEVIIPRPYWVSYPAMVQLSDGVPVFMDTDKEFRPLAGNVEKVMTARTKALIINSPSNPAGAVINPDELREIAYLAARMGFYVISDEIYEKIIYGAEHLSVASLGKEAKDVTFTVNGMSKSHAIQGWRVGYIGGPASAIKAITNIQSHSTSNICNIAQYAAAGTLNDETEITLLAANVAEFKARRDYTVSRLNSIPGVECPMPGGAFYVFPSIPMKDDMEFAKQLLEDMQVAVVPGSEFGVPGRIRMSYATSVENIKEGIDRIAEFCRRL